MTQTNNHTGLTYMDYCPATTILLMIIEHNYCVPPFLHTTAHLAHSKSDNRWLGLREGIESELRSWDCVCVQTIAPKWAHAFSPSIRPTQPTSPVSTREAFSAQLASVEIIELGFNWMCPSEYFAFCIGAVCVGKQVSRRMNHTNPSWQCVCARTTTNLLVLTMMDHSSLSCHTQ